MYQQNEFHDHHQSSSLSQTGYYYIPEACNNNNNAHSMYVQCSYIHTSFFKMNFNILSLYDIQIQMSFTCVFSWLLFIS